MRTGLSLLVLAGTLVSGAAGAQSAEELATRGIPGYLDPQTNLFVAQAARRTPSAVALADLTPLNANIKVTDTITIVSSSLTTNAVISCTVTLSLAVFDGGGEAYLETATGLATRNGSTATCAVTVPFGWKLADASKDQISVVLSMTANDSTKSFTRTESQSLGFIMPPAGGTTTALTTTSRI